MRQKLLKRGFFLGIFVEKREKLTQKPLFSLFSFLFTKEMTENEGKELKTGITDSK